MRVLVVGGSGLVGSHILAEAERRGHHVVGTYRSFVLPGLRRLDLDDEAATAAVLQEIRPDWVVHAAGWTWVDGCETDPARAMRENAAQPARLAELCGEIGARFVYFSTTYVFDGTAGPYRETDSPSPINVYSRSKLAGERGVLEATRGSALVPRIICVWGREAQQKNFAYQVMRAVGAGQTLKIPSDQEGNPTWAGDIAAWTLDLLEAGECGIWHLAGEGARMTREGWLCAILRGLEADADLATRISRWRYEAVPTSVLAQPAPRPLRVGAVTERIQSQFPRVARLPDDLSVLRQAR